MKTVQIVHIGRCWYVKTAVAGFRQDFIPCRSKKECKELIDHGYKGWTLLPEKCR